MLDVLISRLMTALTQTDVDSHSNTAVIPTEYKNYWQSSLLQNTEEILWLEAYNMLHGVYDNNCSVQFNIASNTENITGK